MNPWLKYAKKLDDEKEDVREEARELGQALAKRKKGKISKKKVAGEKDDVDDAKEELEEEKKEAALSLARAAKLSAIPLMAIGAVKAKKHYDKKKKEEEKKEASMKYASTNRGIKEHDATGKLSKVVTGKPMQPKTYRPLDTSKRRIIQGRLPMKDCDGTEVGLNGLRKGAGRPKSYGGPNKLAPMPPKMSKKAMFEYAFTKEAGAREVGSAIAGGARTVGGAIAGGARAVGRSIKRQNARAIKSHRDAGKKHLDVAGQYKGEARRHAANAADPQRSKQERLREHRLSYKKERQAKTHQDRSGQTLGRYRKATSPGRRKYRDLKVT